MLRVSDNGRFLVREDGSPFFYLGDTAWEMLYRLNREEIRFYLRRRAELGFTVVQAVLLSEFNDLRTPCEDGHLPVIDGDPSRPNEGFFAFVDWVVAEAAKLGLHMALLPAWGNKWCEADAPVFDEPKAEAYGRFLASRYGPDAPVIWILGGDRRITTDSDRAVIRALARGLGSGHLRGFHPPGGPSSAHYWPDEPWLDFHVVQSGHVPGPTPNQERLALDYDLVPVKPCMDGEPCYEDSPIMTADWQRTERWFGAWDVRKAAYRAVFAGAHGHTYGCHDVWQMRSDRYESINGARTMWREALEFAGARQMGYLRRLMESRPFLSRVPDPSVVIASDSDPWRAAVATRDAAGAMVYLPWGGSVKVSFGASRGKWFDPRTGEWSEASCSGRVWESPSSGEDCDWVLVLEGG